MHSFSDGMGAAGWMFMAAMVACIGLVSLALTLGAVFMSGKLSKDEDEDDQKPDEPYDPSWKPFNPLDHEQSK